VSFQVDTLNASRGFKTTIPDPTSGFTQSGPQPRLPRDGLALRSRSRASTSLSTAGQGQDGGWGANRRTLLSRFRSGLLR